MWVNEEILPRRVVRIIDHLWQGYFNIHVLETASTVCLCNYNFAIEFISYGPGGFKFGVGGRNSYNNSVNKIVCFTVDNLKPFELFAIYVNSGYKRYALSMDSVISKEDVDDMLNLFYKEIDILVSNKNKINLKQLEYNLDFKDRDVLQFLRHFREKNKTVKSYEW
jgi:hypothetical protein